MFNEVTAMRGWIKAGTSVWSVPRCVLISKRMAMVTWECVLPSRGDVTHLCWPLPCRPSGEMAASLAARHVGLCQGQKDQVFSDRLSPIKTQNGTLAQGRCSAIWKKCQHSPVLPDKSHSVQPPWLCGLGHGSQWQIVLKQQEVSVSDPGL